MTWFMSGYNSEVFTSHRFQQDLEAEHHHETQPGHLVGSFLFSICGLNWIKKPQHSADHNSFFWIKMDDIDDLRWFCSLASQICQRLWHFGLCGARGAGVDVKTETCWDQGPSQKNVGLNSLRPKKTKSIWSYLIKDILFKRLKLQPPLAGQSL